MTEENIKQEKYCPNCKRLTPIDQFKKFESRSNGKVRTLWRCPICEQFKQAAKQASKIK